MEVSTSLSVPEQLVAGTLLTKVTSASKQKQVVFRIDPDQGQILWPSKKDGIIPMESIKEIRSGQDASYDLDQLSLSPSYLPRFISVIYILNGIYRTLNIVAPDEVLFKLWDSTIRRLHTIREGILQGLGHLEMRQAIWERMYWKGADEENDRKLDFDDVQRLCLRLHVNPSDSVLRKLFDQADTKHEGSLDYSAFQQFVKLLKRRPELDALYEKVCLTSPDKTFNFPTFEKFMREQQKSAVSHEDLAAIFNKYSSTPAGNQPATMTLSSFTTFLLSPDNSVSPSNESINQDMSHPLSHYYISSSHNTYLVGYQLAGVSTTEGYIRALLCGCRSVELDIYDGDHGEEPIITHGKTLTKHIPLRAICTAINKYAFIASPYPVIISAEVHCSVEGQDMIVKVMRECFGGRLVCDEEIAVNGGAAKKKIDVLPSVDSLKEKFLLKAKNLHVVEQLEAAAALATAKTSASRESRTIEVESATSSDTSSSDTESASSSTIHRVKAEMIGELKSLKSKLRAKVRKSLTPRSGSPLPKPKHKMSLSLASLLVYTVGVRCRGLPSAVPHLGSPGSPYPTEPHYEPEHIFSLSENKANRMIKKNMIELIRHCESHLVRVYPKGLRVSSSNYEPHAYWAAGVQVVALNWQTFDFGYMMNQAMFRQNGRCGYVLKPLVLRTHDNALLTKRTKHFLDVTVISAQQLPRPRDKTGKEIIDAKAIIDPLVEVSLHIPDWSSTPFLPESTRARYIPASKATTTKATSARRVSFRTPEVRDNGFNPVWQEELSLPFDCVGGREGGMMDLVFVKFCVWQEGKDDEDDEPLAVFCAPVGNLGTGFRHLPLHDLQCSQHLFSTLFVQIGIRDAD